MKRSIAIALTFALLSALALPLVVLAQPGVTEKVEFANYYVILAMRGPNWKSQNTEEGFETRMKVMDSLKQSILSGEVIIAGIVNDDSGADFIMIVETDDEMGLRKLLKEAPVVKSGFYKISGYTWFAPKGLKLEMVPRKN
jgi:hypothetical protein